MKSYLRRTLCLDERIGNVADSSIFVIDIPALGVPIDTGYERFASKGRQYKRVAAIVGDVFYHATRLNDARHYALYSPTYIYRFNTRPFENNTNATYTDYRGRLDPPVKLPLCLTILNSLVRGRNMWP